jgi:hypothetical protein
MKIGKLRYACSNNFPNENNFSEKIVAQLTISY